MGKWIALGLIAAGIFMMAAATYANTSASFEDGSFVGVIVGFVAGIGCVAVGVIWLGALAFSHL